MKNFLDDTPLGDLIDRTVDGWAKILGFTNETYRGDDPSTPDVIQTEVLNTGKKKAIRKKKATRKKKVTNE